MIKKGPSKYSQPISIPKNSFDFKEITTAASLRILVFEKITGSCSRVIFPAPPPITCIFSGIFSNKLSKKSEILELSPSIKTTKD